MAAAQSIRALAYFAENILGLRNKDPDQVTDPQTNKIAFLNAQPDLDKYIIHSKIHQFVVCEQSFRPHYLALQKSGYEVWPELVSHKNPKDCKFAACLMVITKFRAINEDLVRRAMLLTRENGLIIISGAKKSGIVSLRKKIAGTQDFIETRAKFHSQVFWFKNNTRDLIVTTPISYQIIKDNNHEYITRPGLFSANKIDLGSAMLARHFTDDIHGKIADLGAGWGYLSSKLMQRSDKITAIDLFEADWHGLDACRKNLGKITNQSIKREFGKIYRKTKINFFWHDILSEPIDDKYDWVIMNQPFHQDIDTRLDMGKTFIKNAASILTPGGKLLMVANQHLAYEACLKQHFSHVDIRQQADGFKILLAKS